MSNVFELLTHVKENNASLYYVDEEDSVIPVDSSWELHEAIRLAKVNKKPLRLFLSDKSRANDPMLLNVNKSKSEEFPCNEDNPVSSNKKTCPKLHTFKPKENTNSTTPPDWFVCYMKKFKNDLISEVKSSVIEAVENVLKKKKKLSYLKAEDLLCEKIETLSLDKTQTKKKKKMLEKDSVDASDQRGLKVKKLEKLFPSKFEKLEKLDNKSKLLLEEKRKILEKKRSTKSKLEKIALDLSERKYSFPFSALFGTPDICLPLLPKEDFVVSLDVINNGMHTLQSSKLECFDFTEFHPESLYMAIPKIKPGEKWSTTLRGKACKTLGLHHFKCRVVEDTKIISPEFTCYARVESNEPKVKKSLNEFFKTCGINDTVQSSQAMFRVSNPNDMIETQKKIEENIKKIQARLNSNSFIRNPVLTIESWEDVENECPIIRADQDQFSDEKPKFKTHREKVINELECIIKEREKIMDEEEKRDLYMELTKLKEAKQFIDLKISFDCVPLSDQCSVDNQESPFHQFHHNKKGATADEKKEKRPTADEKKEKRPTADEKKEKRPTADEKKEKHPTDDVDYLRMYVKEVVEKADKFMKMKKRTINTEELEKRLYKDLQDCKFEDFMRKRMPSCSTPQSSMIDHENSRLQSPEVVKNPMKTSLIDENMTESLKKELNTLNDESNKIEHSDTVRNDSSDISSDSEVSLLCMSPDDENFIIINVPSGSCSPSPTESVHEDNIVSDNNSDNADKENECFEFEEQLKSVITKIKLPDPIYKSVKEAGIQGIINREGEGLVEEAQILEEVIIEGEAKSQGEGVIEEEARNLKEKETAKEFYLKSQSPLRSRHSPFGEETAKSKWKKMKSKSTEYHFTAANLSQPIFTVIPKTVSSGPSQFIFTGEEERMTSRPGEGLEEKQSRFIFTGEKEEKAKKEEGSRRRNVPKTDSVGRIIYAINSSGYCLPVGDVFEIDGTQKIHAFETGDDRNFTQYVRRNGIYNENSGVNLLPNALMNGASNVASIAFNTAKSVISNLQSAFVTEGKTELGKPAFEEKKNVSLEEAMFTLYEMGFSDLEKNRTLLLEFGNDLRKVVGELVRQSKSSERPQ